MARTAQRRPGLLPSPTESLIMSAIQTVEAGFYLIPLPQVLSDSMHGEIPAFQLNTVKVTDKDGATGVGYTYTVGRNGAAVDAILRREMGEMLIGQEADRIEYLWQKMWWGLHYGGRGGPSMLALSAVDMALWDLKAKKLGLPLWNLLGGYDDQVPCYAGGVDLDFGLDELLAQTDRNLGKGFRAIKMKVGRARLSEDVERVKAMRAHLGADFPLMADANMKWTIDEAIRAARALQSSELVWLEEPTIPDDPAGHARILREGGVPIAAGENLRTPWEFKLYMAADAVSFPEPDVTNCGGVTGFMKVARLAEAFNLPVTSHGAHDVTVHLLAACPNRSYLEVHSFGLDRYIADPLVIKDGNAVASSRPGHGVEFDWTALSRATG
jgi:L-alanine-DL-glutamate epimerase-like enolase superfamily enzyme